jgi:hypothetical protein
MGQAVMASILDYQTVSGATSYPLEGFVPTSVSDPNDYGSADDDGAREVEITLSARDRRIWLAEHARRELNELLRLRPRWDGHRARSITDEAVRSTVQTLFEIAEELSLPPQFFPLPDGGIQYEWHVGGQSVEVEVGAGGIAHVLATDRDGEVLAEGQLGSDGELIQSVGAIVRQLSFRAASARWDSAVG